jgi:hypothetical protein
MDGQRKFFVGTRSHPEAHRRKNKSCKCFCLEYLQLFTTSGGGGNRTRNQRTFLLSVSHLLHETFLGMRSVLFVAER